MRVLWFTNTPCNYQNYIGYGGGGWLTAAFMNSMARIVNSALELGRSLGTSIRMAFSGKTC